MPEITASQAAAQMFASKALYEFLDSKLICELSNVAYLELEFELGNTLCWARQVFSAGIEPSPKETVIVVHHWIGGSPLHLVETNVILRLVKNQGTATQSWVLRKLDARLHQTHDRSVHKLYEYFGYVGVFTRGIYLGSSTARPMSDFLFWAVLLDQIKNGFVW